MIGSYKPQFANRWDFDTLEGEDMDDFMAEIEADELSDDGEDHEAALDHWREQQDADGGDELPCGLSRAQLRTAAKELFSGLAEVLGRILKVSESGEVRRGKGSGSKVSASQVAAVGVALQLPGFERSATLARVIGCTRASVSIWSAEWGRQLGVTSQMSARKQVGGILAMARVKAGMGPRVAPVIQVSTVEDREKIEVREWLKSLPEEEREEARKALGLKKAV